MAFQVGVTGHRNIPGGDTRALREAAARLLRDIGVRVRALHAADQAKTEPLFTSAPPALRCICGLAAGADALLAEAALDAGWSLVALLPFPRGEYEGDFEPGEKLDQFRALLGRSAVVCELAGRHDRGGEPYAYVGQQIVEQSDLLVAIWDGLPPRGPGGTGDVVEQAMQRGLPVAVMRPDAAGVVSWHAARTGDMEATVAAALSPPPGTASGEAESFLREVPRGTGWAGRAVRVFEGLMLVGARFETPPARPVAPEIETELLRFFLPADRLATENAARYRAAGLLRYGLIPPATLGAFVGFYGASAVQPFGFLLQFVALVTTVWFSLRGRWAVSQRRFVAYRALAEFLRNARLLAPLRAVPVLPGAPAHQAHAADWTAWYGRAAIRSMGVLPGSLDAAAVATAAAFLARETQGQIDYLVGRAARFTVLGDRLRRIGVGLFMCGVAAAALRFGFMLAGAGDDLLLILNESALALPAMAPVFLGLLSFGEYGRLATRYRAVAAELQAQLARLEAARDRPSVLRIARRVTEVMLAEGADWQLLVKASTVSAY